MQEFYVQLTIQKTIEKYPGVSPRVISDNGPQFISKDFAQYQKVCRITTYKNFG